MATNNNNRRPVIYGTFGSNSVLCRAGPLVYGARNLVNQDGALTITSDQNNLYVNVATPPEQQKLVLAPNTALFPILLQRDQASPWLVHPNLLQFMQIEASNNISTSSLSLFPTIQLAPSSTYHVSASVAVDIGLYPDNFAANAHYIVLDLITSDNESLLSSTTVVWNPAGGPATRSVQLSGRVRNGGGEPLSLQLTMATSAALCSVVPRFFVMTQMFNDF